MIAHDHLFGVVPQVAPVDSPAPVASTSDFQLNGIVYSSDPSASLALLDQGGTGIVAHQGMRLPDGARVVSIQSDRVVIERQGVRESVLLNIKKADLNAHFSPAQFADSGDTDREKQNDNPARGTTASMQEPFTDPAALVTGNRPTLVIPHFKALRQLRGQNAMRRFQHTIPSAP